MFVRTSVLASVALPALVVAGTVPAYPGMSIIFHDDFSGHSGDPINTDVWNIAGPAVKTNYELQNYSDATSNLQLSGGGTVQLVPWLSDTGKWSSSRIETKTTWTPQAGKQMFVAASARTGDAAAANTQGIWSAIWMLGDSIRHGTGWPACGEIDIMEMVDNHDVAYSTVHCTSAICQPDTSVGYQGSIGTDADWHTYGVLIDRTTNDWTTEFIQFSKDGNEFFTMYGSDVGDEAVWGALAHSPLYMIINVAVGGSWPGDPNSATIDGYENMLEVEYVAVYES